MESKVIAQLFENHTIRQRTTDGYLSATDMCKVFGKKFETYYKTKNTKEYINELSMSLGGDMVDVKHGGAPNEHGSWIHPQVATHLAQWLSPKFAVQVNRWVLRYLAGDITLVKDVVQQHELVTGNKITKIDFDYEEKYDQMIKRRLEIDEQFNKVNEGKIKCLNDLEAIKNRGDALVYVALKNSIMNSYAYNYSRQQTDDQPLMLANDESQLLKNKDISTMYNDIVGGHPKSTDLIKLGKLISNEYRRRYNSEPMTTDKHVNGAIRPVKVYHPRDYNWIEHIIHNYKPSN